MPSTEPDRRIIVGCRRRPPRVVAPVVAGQAGIDRRGVGVVDAVVHRADDRRAMQLLRQPRQVLAKLNAGHVVAIGLNSPRMPSGASGFMSHMSRWLGPPLRNNQHAGVGPRLRVRRLAAADSRSQQPRQRKAHQPQAADLQHVPARNDRRTTGSNDVGLASEDGSCQRCPSGPAGVASSYRVLEWARPRQSLSLSQIGGGIDQRGCRRGPLPTASSDRRGTTANFLRRLRALAITLSIVTGAPPCRLLSSAASMKA